MLFKTKLLPKSIGVVFGIIMLFLSVSFYATAQNNGGKATLIDTTPPKGLPYPIHDNRGDFISSGTKSTYDFNKPSNFTDSVSYDFKTRQYTVYEKIGEKYYRTPTIYSFDEYWQMRGRQAEVAYFKKRANTIAPPPFLS